MSLKDVPIPPVPGLTDGPDPIVVDSDAAIVLGKALFWDINVGSDGMACASCHFHAGADARTKNQIAPSAMQGGDDDAEFDYLADGGERGTNYTLTRSDFPIHQTADPLSPNTAILSTSDDVVGSAGTFGGQFRDVHWFGTGDDDCVRVADPVFHQGAVGTRRVEPRHTPTVINAVFNHRNFWDGRANNVFNGSSAWGERDPDAGVWIDTPSGLQKQRLHLINSSLASQAVAPPLDAVEMGCEGRRFADLGRKLMWRRPLARQNVHWNDSILGPYARSTADTIRPGLDTFYYNLVRKAFNEKYWSSTERGGVLGAPVQRGRMRPLPYDQFESNFAMFFGLAIQLYESTLVSDDSPFDRAERDSQGLPVGLAEEEFEGLQEFRVAHCSLCHIGPLMTSAAVATNAELVKDNPGAFGNQLFAISTSENVITRRPVFHEAADGTIEEAGALLDTGFSSTGVILSDWDIGLGGTDPYGNPLSFSEQYLQLLAGDTSKVVDEDVHWIRPCDFDLPIAVDMDRSHPLLFTRVDGIKQQEQDVDDCYNVAGAFVPTESAAAAQLADPAGKKMLSGVRGAFKIPTLRNVELTGPYMHNGSMATLEEVVEFYTRGGNFDTQSKDFGFVFSQAALRFVPDKRANMVAFMKTLTDDRVRYKRAPFDHPELIVPHGHAGDHLSVAAGNPLSADLAADEFLIIPAVGAGGIDDPLQSFEDILDP
jgi:cytochrome c peroxidase